MSDSAPPPEWLEAANRLATVAAQLSSVAHEANNLLQIASGSAEMLEMMPDDPAAVVRRAAVIREHAQRAAGLLAAVLEFSRDESMSVESVDMGPLVDRAIEMRKYVLNKRSISVHVDHVAAAPSARANRRRTLQILLNVLMNAERALADTADPALTIRVAPEGDDVAVVVQDNGAGVEPSPPAWTGDASPHETPRLGIGLRVADWLAAEQRGRLVVGRGDRGTIVTLRLPAVRA